MEMPRGHYPWGTAASYEPRVGWAAKAPSLKGGGRMCCTLLLSPIQLFVTPWTVARQAPLSMGFSRKAQKLIKECMLASYY